MHPASKVKFSHGKHAVINKGYFGNGAGVQAESICSSKLPPPSGLIPPSSWESKAPLPTANSTTVSNFLLVTIFS